MQVFFSYGHDKNEEIVLRLKDDIERQGHYVWIDKYELKGGDDWRREITTGILGSDFMMSFASEHSVRKPGVCLDELMIAVSVKGARVQTVLLESDVEPPKNIGYRNYVNMSDWEQRKGTPEYEKWYAEKLEEILEVVNSPETAKYAKEIEFLKTQLQPDLSSAKKDRLQQEYYCGREWLSARVKDWLEKTEERILLIDGSPGAGKSAFMAHEFIFNSSVGAILFCEWDNPNSNNLDAISRNLVFQLASKLTDYRDNVIKYLKTGQQGEATAARDNVFRFLLLDKLRYQIDGDRPTMLILIDGLDEAGGGVEGGRNKNTLAELLKQEIDNFPRWIRFVVTSRHDDRVTVPLQDVPVIHIDQYGKENARDICQYLAHELENQTFPAEKLDRLTDLCDGNFLYARIIARAIKEKHLSFEEAISKKSGDLGAVYRGYFDRMFPKMEEYEEIYYPVLAALAITEEKIPESTFKKITGWSKRKQVLYMKALAPFLSAGRKYLSLYHKSLQDWLLREDADEYIIDEEDGAKAIADGCFASYEESKEKMNLYELKYLSPSLKKCHDRRLPDVLSDEGYSNLLMSHAREEAASFCYENAVRLAENALDIFRNLGRWEQAARVCLFLAEKTDMMVDLERSIEWCKEGLKTAEDHPESVQGETAGDIWMRLAYVYFRMQKWTDSYESYHSASEVYQASGNLNKEMEAMMMWGNSLRNANKYEKALSVFQDLERMPSFGCLKEETPVLYTEILMYYAWALHEAGKSHEAERYLERAEEMVTEDQAALPERDIAHVYYTWAIVLYNQAEYSRAREYCVKSLEHVRLAYGENAVETCSALNQLGAILQKMDDHTQAIQIFKKSYDIRKNYYGERNLYTTISLRNYAKAILLRGETEEFAKAGEALEKVKTIREELAGEGNGLGWLAHIFLDLADYYEKIGKYDEARDYVYKARELYKDYGIDRDILSCEKQLGIIQLAAGEAENALQTFQDALELSKECYSADHPYHQELLGWTRKCKEAL